MREERRKETSSPGPTELIMNHESVERVDLLSTWKGPAVGFWVSRAVKPRFVAPPQYMGKNDLWHKIQYNYE